jgi:hypothetical protein
MKKQIVVVKKGSSPKPYNSCPMFIDVPPETRKN